jgi:biotin operon repressor
LLYIYLSKFSGSDKKCWPSIKTLSEISGISERQIRYSIQQLEERGYIVKQIRKEGIKNLTNLYVLKYITPKVEIKEDTAHDAGDTAPDAPRALHDMQEGTAPHAPELKSITESHKELNYTSDFKEFWSNYPRHIDKGSAFRCWKTRLKEGYKATDIIQAAKNYTAANKKTEIQFLKHPSTFLGRDKPFEEYIAGVPDTGRDGPGKQINANDSYAATQQSLNKYY